MRSTSRLELEQRSALQYRDASRYARLHTTFFKKVDEAIESATEQIQARGSWGLIFILVHFDDFTMTFYEQHRAQIAKHLDGQQALPVVIKFGLFGPRGIEHAHKLLS